MIEKKELEEVLSPYGKLVLYSKGSMTSNLELYHGKEVKVKVLKQGQEWNICETLKEHIPTTQNTYLRESYLYSDDDVKPYLYSMSAIFLDNIPGKMKESLIEGKTPIGKLIDIFNIETSRDIKKIKICQSKYIAEILMIPEQENIILRQYYIMSNKKPIFLIGEYLPYKMII
ncbi:chorismate--pyruvate lyase family protein [Mesobacillus foraminis]|uniref:Chorismate lyase n=1 Tax=Mesobacillus foraminis TaxID=279826 RepID=A0A4R2AUI5_9BACI|nr:chorismate pyruvate-lyase family protein [Mesobacillus foraminis]TCN17547.1 chorismate lyase [Mesobacillus foraminis]